MAGYTVVNMNDLEDSAAGRDGVEARFGRKHRDSEHLGVSVFRYTVRATGGGTGWARGGRDRIRSSRGRRRRDRQGLVDGLMR
jgi:hypothetical protein